MYSFEIKQAEKIFLVNASGFFKIDEANTFVKDLRGQLSRISNKSDYHLVIDAKEQKTVTQDVQAVLAEAISIYVGTPFKSHHSVVLDSVITKTQIMRAGNMEITKVFQFHDSLQEAINSCK